MARSQEELDAEFRLDRITDIEAVFARRACASEAALGEVRSDSRHRLRPESRRDAEPLSGVAGKRAGAGSDLHPWRLLELARGDRFLLRGGGLRPVRRGRRCHRLSADPERRARRHRPVVPARDRLPPSPRLRARHRSGAHFRLRQLGGRTSRCGGDGPRAASRGRASRRRDQGRDGDLGALRPCAGRRLVPQRASAIHARRRRRLQPALAQARNRRAAWW